MATVEGQRANDNEGPFSIGQNKWPGISKLIEECGEVLQIAGKLIATGGRTDHWSGLNLADELSKELGDLLAAIHFTIEHNKKHLYAPGIRHRGAEKVLLFERWHSNLRGPDDPSMSDARLLGLDLPPDEADLELADNMARIREMERTADRDSVVGGDDSPAERSG